MSGIGRIPVEAFKKGIFQIMQTDAMQAVLADFRLGFGLKYDGGQLFMITNEDKLTNSISTLPHYAHKEAPAVVVPVSE